MNKKKRDKKNEKKWGQQRIERGFCDRDLWSFDSYLAEIISKGCKELSKIAHSMPSELMKDNGIDATKEESDKAFQEWKDILNKISEGFEWYRREQFAYNKVNEVYTFDEGLKDSKSSYNEAWDLFRKWFGGLWD